MSYDELMSDVIDIKDIGSGVVGAVECDYLGLPQERGGFSNLDRAGRQALSLPFQHHVTNGTGKPAIQHSAS